jgi:GlcNAc-P-P-Und epimerase
VKTLLTGASGFLGSYILLELPGEVITLGRSSSNSILCNLEQKVPVVPEVDLVVHNAGLAHRIPKNPEEESHFYQVNLFGTQNLLKALDRNQAKPKALVFISTVAVYGLEKGEFISEKTEPKPKTPYAKSKFEAELLLQKWAKQNQVNLSILRLPLVAGAKDTPGNLGAMIKAIQKGYYLRIGKGQARKSMVLAEDVAKLIPFLMNTSAVYNLTDGIHPSVSELEEYLGGSYGRKIKTISPWILRLATFFGDLIPGFPINSYRLSKLGESLTFDDSKAKSELGWNPRPVVGNLDLEVQKK